MLQNMILHLFRWVAKKKKLYTNTHTNLGCGWMQHDKPPFMRGFLLHQMRFLTPPRKSNPQQICPATAGKASVWVCFSVYRAGQSLEYLLMLAVPYNGIGFTMSTHAYNCTQHTLNTAVRLPFAPKGHQGCYLTSLWSISMYKFQQKLQVSNSRGEHEYCENC